MKLFFIIKSVEVSPRPCTEWSDQAAGDQQTGGYHEEGVGRTRTRTEEEI